MGGVSDTVGSIAHDYRLVFMVPVCTNILRCDSVRSCGLAVLFARFDEDRNCYIISLLSP